MTQSFKNLNMDLSQHILWIIIKVQEDERQNLHTKQQSHILLYFIYLHKGFMSVIMIISVQLDYARSTARAV